MNRRGNGSVRIQLQLPALTFIRSILHNPIYAGAYVYGQRTGKMVLGEDGRIMKRLAPPPQPEQCRIFIRGHHESYIEWQKFEENQTMLRRNALRLGSDESVSVVRKAHGLLSGLLRCGRCGRKMHVRYWGKERDGGPVSLLGNIPESGGNYCIAFGGANRPPFFGDVAGGHFPVWTAGKPEGDEKRTQYRSRWQACSIAAATQQCEYESQRAFEQYNEVDARNRLVAAELERRWNHKLEDVARVKKAFEEAGNQRQSLTAEQERQLLEMGACFREAGVEPVSDGAEEENHPYGD